MKSPEINNFASGHQPVFPASPFPTFSSASFFLDSASCEAGKHDKLVKFTGLECCFGIFGSFVNGSSNSTQPVEESLEELFFYDTDINIMQLDDPLPVSLS